MIYIIGLGLNIKSLTKEGIEAIDKCKKIYLEDYTVDFPYPTKELEKVIGKKLISANREKVENLEIIKEAKKQDIALLVYGSPLFATTHITLIQEAKKQKVKYEIIYNSSVFDAIAETGLQLYKFGKITSMPCWQKNYNPMSFMGVISDNLKINAHTLLLIDIGLEIDKALEQLEISIKKCKIKLNKIIICSQLGTDNKKVYYNTIENFKLTTIKKPYCIIIPSDMHFIEKEAVQ